MDDWTIISTKYTFTYCEPKGIKRNKSLPNMTSVNTNYGTLKRNKSFSNVYQRRNIYSSPTTIKQNYCSKVHNFFKTIQIKTRLCMNNFFQRI